MRPLAFRIRDFKSIRDTGTCNLSGDHITVLAGQNEAGKTAILSALRDFDLEVGDPPITADYLPDDERIQSAPSVSVLFDAEPRVIFADLEGEGLDIPAAARLYFRRNTQIWITRDLQSGKYSLDQEFTSRWDQPVASQTGTAETSTDPPKESESSEEEEGDAPEPRTHLDASGFADWLRTLWPSFIYFDSFQDSLPREVDFSDLKPPKPAASAQVAGASASSRRASTAKAPAAVLDFVVLAGLDVDRVAGLAENDKALGNYLASRGAAITGDFLTYWKQKADTNETVEIKVKGIRDSEGALKLAFYVHDVSDQYPDQRSKGFLWFLSFYLKLAAAQKKDPERKRLLLIDEPGSYLHARAQKDVLHLFESRIAQNDEVIYSTHSPYLIPPDRLHRLRIVLKTTDAGTRILDRLTHPALRGDAYGDSLSPVVASIGIDISQSITFNKRKNLFVEGISDLMYLAAWAKLLRSDLLDEFNIFPGTGATKVPMLASLFIGWGFKFVALLDNDDQGKATHDKLVRNLLVPASRVIRPADAKTVEDLLSPDDFRTLLHAMDESLTLNSSEAPSAAIKRQSVDKVLLSRTFSEEVAKGGVSLTKKSQEGIAGLLRGIFDAWEK